MKTERMPMKTHPKSRKTRKGRSLQRMVIRLRRRYVRTVKIGDKWNTYLQIDHQGFCVVEQTTRHRAQWFGKMLAVALERMLAAERCRSATGSGTITETNRKPENMSEKTDIQKPTGKEPVRCTGMVWRLYRCPKCKLLMRMADADVWGKIVRCTNCAEAVADNRTMPPPNNRI